MRWTPLLLALTVVACTSSDTVSTDTTPPISTQVDSTTTALVAATTQTTTSVTVETAVAGTLIEISVIGGEVTGGGKVAVRLGETVTIRVTADVSDEIHLHGYDIAVEVAPVTTAEVVFIAGIPGIFEIELEESGLMLAEIEVS